MGGDGTRDGESRARLRPCRITKRDNHIPRQMLNRGNAFAVEVPVGDAMLFERTEEQEMLTDTLTRFVVDVVKPHATAWSQAGKMPVEALEGLRDLGVLGLELPESMGGAGFGTVEWVQAVESLATGDGGLALSLVVHSVAVSALARSGEVHAATAKSLAAGEAYATVAWVDGRSKALVVEAKGDELVLSGAKEAVALAEHADSIQAAEHSNYKILEYDPTYTLLMGTKTAKIFSIKDKGIFQRANHD